MVRGMATPRDQHRTDGVWSSCRGIPVSDGVLAWPQVE